MTIKQSFFPSASMSIHRNATWLPALALCILGTAFAATTAVAAPHSSDANARYQAERAVCNSGQSNQDRATCLREAGAALQESKKGDLRDDQGANQQNALIRCNALPVADRDACQRRIKGEGTTSGSASEGGVMRELVVPDK